MDLRHVDDHVKSPLGLRRLRRPLSGHYTRRRTPVPRHELKDHARKAADPDAELAWLARPEWRDVDRRRAPVPWTHVREWPGTPARRRRRRRAPRLRLSGGPAGRGRRSGLVAAGSGAAEGAGEDRAKRARRPPVPPLRPSRPFLSPAVARVPSLAGLDPASYSDRDPRHWLLLRRADARPRDYRDGLSGVRSP